jgi:hypothetical protein
MMRLGLAFVLLLLAIVVPATATPSVCPTSGTYADLVATNAAGGCFIAGNLFSDCVYQSTASGGAVSVPVDAFAFTTVTIPAVPAYGFQFGFSLFALPGQTAGIQLSYLITGQNITSNHLVLLGGATGSAVASTAESYCKGGPIETCTPPQADSLLTYFVGTGPTKQVDSDFFGPVNQLGVFKSINVAAAGGGFATVNGMISVIDQAPQGDNVPEPATMFLGGVSLAALGMARRFRGMQL